MSERTPPPTEQGYAFLTAAGELTAARGASYQRDLLSWRATTFVDGVKIEPSPSAECTYACRYAGCYRLEDAPDYPLGPCDNNPEVGCLCGWYPIFRDESVAEWKSPDRRHRLAGTCIKSSPRPLPLKPAERASFPPSASPIEAPPAFLMRVWRWLLDPKRCNEARGDSFRDGDVAEPVFGDVAEIRLVNVRRDDDSSCPQFTVEQHGAIRRAIMAGRKALSERGPVPAIFADAFLRAGGFHVPGLEVPRDRLRAVGSFVLLSLDSARIDADELRRGFSWAGDEVARAVLRETLRAHVETIWHVLSRPDQVEGIQITVSSARSNDACAKVMLCDNFGMGEGIYPKFEILVLPPCCDGSIRLASVCKEVQR